MRRSENVNKDERYRKQSFKHFKLKKTIIFQNDTSSKIAPTSNKIQSLHLSLLNIRISIYPHIRISAFSTKPQHPCFSTLVNEHSQYFQNINNLLLQSVSKESLDSGMTKQDLVKQEAILNCADKKWSSFLCILGLSSVLGRNIHTYYPDSGEDRYKVL